MRERPSGQAEHSVTGQDGRRSGVPTVRHVQNEETSDEALPFALLRIRGENLVAPVLQSLAIGGKRLFLEGDRIWFVDAADDPNHDAAPLDEIVVECERILGAGPPWRRGAKLNLLQAQLVNRMDLSIAPRLSSSTLGKKMHPQFNTKWRSWRGSNSDIDKTNAMPLHALEPVPSLAGLLTCQC